MGKINRSVLNKSIKKVLVSPQAKRSAYQQANTAFEQAKAKMIKEFDSHPITKELSAGPDSRNVSGTLGGRGNLFSFIGFMSTDNPTFIVRELLKQSRLKRVPRVTPRGRNEFIISFQGIMPSKRDLESVSPMPFEKGRSWLTSIERGISGLSYYIYNKLKNIKSSRSGTGIQISHPYISGLRYKPVSYISPILNNFKKELSG